jgi:hypothetical protein
MKYNILSFSLQNGHPSKVFANLEKEIKSLAVDV